MKYLTMLLYSLCYHILLMNIIFCKDEFNGFPFIDEGFIYVQKEHVVKRQAVSSTTSEMTSSGMSEEPTTIIYNTETVPSKTSTISTFISTTTTKVPSIITNSSLPISITTTKPVENSTESTTSASSSLTPTNILTSTDSSTTTTTTTSTTTTSTTTTTTTTTTITSTSRTTTSTQNIISTTQAGPTTTTKLVTGTIYSGSLDSSLKSNIMNLEPGLGYSIAIDSLPVSFMSNQFSQIQVYKNGFLTLGNIAASFSRQLPFINLNINFPLIAPFWSDLYLDSESDITFGSYNNIALNKEPNLVSSISNDIFNYQKSNFIPEAVTIITWKNIKPSIEQSNQKINFQVIFAQSYSTEKTFILFNYQKVSSEWSDGSKTVLIGYTDGIKPLVGGISQFSNTIDTTIDSTDIFSTIGNTNTLARFVYDITYVITNKCDNWYAKNVRSNKRKSISDLIDSKKYIDCPSNLNQIKLNKAFSYLNAGYWQSNVACYKVTSKSLLGNDKLQQICCYNPSLGNLDQNDKNSGFLYNENEVDEVLQAGSDCCLNQNWNQCSKFYEIYPKNTDKNYNAPVYAMGAGDPQIFTFDGLSYTFNGYGQFIMTKTLDSSFEMHAETEVFQNVDNPNIVGTFFTAFAMKTSLSPIVEIRISDPNSQSPYFMLFIDQKEQKEFENNFNYFKEFPTTNPTVSVSQNTMGVIITLENGVFLEISFSSADINKNQKVSWIVNNINLMSSFISKFSNKLIGLMGNLNKNINDDLISRNGTRPQNFTEKLIYPIASSWQINENDTVLFAPFTSSRDQKFTNFLPTFTDDLVVSDEIKALCNGDKKCIVDATLTGVKDIGAKTLGTFQVQEQAAKVANNRAPIVQLRDPLIKIDASSLTPIDIIVDVFDLDNGDLVKIELQISNASKYSILNLPSTLVSSATITIRYTPTRGEYPVFSFIAIDSLGAASMNTSQFQICDCKSVDSDNQCQYGSILLAVNAYVSLVRCKCSSYYIGDFCDKTIDYCSLYKPCESISIDYNIVYKCQTYSVTVQKATNKTYYCDGTCPNLNGYTKDENGFCIDVNECLNKNICPSNSVCKNSIGSYTCKCPSGYNYNDKTIACDDIDECKQNLNSCEQKCINNLGSYKCDCNAGFKLVNDIKCIKDNSVIIPGCSTLNCAQICTLDDNSNTICKCNNGYDLAADGKSCVDLNECALNTSRCSNGCFNTIGSFYCICPIGMILDTDQRTCINCPFNRYGINCSKTCNCINALTCNRETGCICVSGYTGAFCETDIDECKSQPQYYYSNCINTQGGFNYQCDPGFTKRDGNITDYNCYDINECLTPNICPTNSICNNTIGSYNCNCFGGLKFDLVTKTCIDINECLNPAQCPVNSYCTNLFGSYRCDCNLGFNKTVSSTNLSPNCIDINECLNDPCRYNEICQNTQGSYLCVCKTGYLLSNRTCVDINECDNSPCSTNATCINTDGSYLCPCKQYYTLVNDKCLFQERITNSIQFQLLFKNNSCNSNLNDLANIVQLVYKKVNFTTSVSANRSSCNNGTEIIQLKVTFTDASLKPTDETQAVLIMTRNFANVDVALLLNSLLTVPLNDSDQCIVFSTYNLCQHGGFCTVNNNKPVCECPSFTKSAYSGQYCESMKLIETSSTTSTTTLSKRTLDDTVLVIAIVLPFIGFMTLLILTGVIVYYCYRRRANNYMKHSDDEGFNKKGIKIPRISNMFKSNNDNNNNNNNNIKNTIDKSDFEFNNEDLINFDDSFVAPERQNTYKVNYPVESSILPDGNYFRTLEKNASLKQSSTIVRPNSTFSDFSNTLPTAYHEKTTPYADYPISEIDDTFDPFGDNDDDDFSEVIEAINPNVHIPRPRVQKHPFGFFKN